MYISYHCLCPKAGEGNLSLLPNFTSNSDRSRYRSCGIWKETSCSSVFGNDYVPFMNHPDSIDDIINACKECVDVVEPAMLVTLFLTCTDRTINTFAACNIIIYFMMIVSNELGENVLQFKTVLQFTSS